jgi:hypothetical protein
VSPQTDFEKLLRDAIEKTQEKAKQSSDDLYRYSSEVAEAVDRVTGGLGELKLVPLPNRAVTEVAYQLELRKTGSESPPSPLGVYLPAEGGYPVKQWHDFNQWRAAPNQGNETFNTPQELENHFKWLASSPESKLVILVAFLKQLAQSTGPVGAAGS